MQNPRLLQDVPAGQGPSGLPWASVAQLGGREPSAGMQWRPSAGMPLPPPPPVGVVHLEFSQRPTGQSLFVRQPTWHTPLRQRVPPTHSPSALHSGGALHTRYLMPKKLHDNWQVVPTAQPAFVVHPKFCAEAADGTIKRMPSSAATMTASPTRWFMTTSLFTRRGRV